MALERLCQSNFLKLETPRQLDQPAGPPGYDSPAAKGASWPGNLESSDSRAVCLAGIAESGRNLSLDLQACCCRANGWDLASSKAASSITGRLEELPKPPGLVNSLTSWLHPWQGCPSTGASAGLWGMWAGRKPGRFAMSNLPIEQGSLRWLVNYAVFRAN